MEPAEITFENILKRYNKNPKGWNFSVGRGHDEKFFDILISHEKDVWQVKLDTLYRPNPLGVGVKVGRSGKVSEAGMVAAYCRCASVGSVLHGP